jgi:hypothetical protein
VTSTTGPSPSCQQIAQTFDFVAVRSQLVIIVYTFFHLASILGLSSLFDIQSFMCSFVPCSAETEFCWLFIAPLAYNSLIMKTVSLTTSKELLELFQIYLLPRPMVDVGMDFGSDTYKYKFECHYLPHFNSYFNEYEYKTDISNLDPHSNTYSI